MIKLNTKKLITTWILSVMIFSNFVANAMIYPLSQVSKVECRMTHRTEHSNDCKVTLPKIAGWNYSAHSSDPNYTKIYTMLRKWSYIKDTWNTEGSHVWVDIATAKWTPVYAVFDWEITDAGVQAGYGSNIKLKINYGWANYYIVYAHLDKIDVKKGQKVKKWDKIGEVWNTWVSGWAMWGFHLHFEVNKETNGKLTYAFYGCEDWGMWKNEYQVVNDGKCRDTLDSRTLDPIVFLEKAGATIKTADDTNSWWSPSQWTDNIQEVKPPVPSGAKDIAVSKPNIALLSADMKDFFTNNQITVSSYIDKLESWKAGKLVIWSYTKWGQEYNGVISEPIEIVSSASDVKINPWSIAMLMWKNEVEITATSPWKKTISINIAWQKLASLDFEVVWWSHSAWWLTFEGKNYKCRYTSDTERMKYFF